MRYSFYKKCYFFVPDSPIPDNSIHCFFILGAKWLTHVLCMVTNQQASSLCLLSARFSHYSQLFWLLPNSGVKWCTHSTFMMTNRQVNCLWLLCTRFSHSRPLFWQLFDNRCKLVNPHLIHDDKSTLKLRFIVILASPNNRLKHFHDVVFYC